MQPYLKTNKLKISNNKISFIMCRIYIFFCLILQYFSISFAAKVHLDSLISCPDIRNDLGDFKLHFQCNNFNETHKILWSNATLQENFGSQYGVRSFLFCRRENSYQLFRLLFLWLNGLVTFGLKTYSKLKRRIAA